MKKIFTLMIMCVMAIAAQAKITIYVQCDTAPFLWTWGAVGGTFDNVGEWPGELQFTDRYTHPDTGESFWAYSFPDEIKQISFLFNNGATPTKQSADIADVTTDRYFILAWDDGEGNVSLQDITEDYIEVPDAEVASLGVSGSHVGWGDAEIVNAEVIEAGKVFKYSLDPSGISDGSVSFKFRPNGTSWLGYGDIYYPADGEAVEGKTSSSEAPKWLESTSDGNFMINLKKFTATAFVFTMTWNGGKSATANWSISAEATNLQELNPEPTEKIWTIAGESALCGEEWNPSNAANDMTKGADGIYRLTLTGVALEAQTYQFKVVADHSWNESYGEGDGNKTVTVDAAGTYDVTFTFNADTKELNAQIQVSTGISSVKSNVSTNAAMFNLQGQRVTNNFRGIAIKNGRKVVVK